MTMNHECSMGTLSFWATIDVRHTVVEAIPFRAVCSAIAQYAFVASDLPVIISLEVHCSLEQQRKMVDVDPARWFAADLHRLPVKSLATYS